MNIFLMILLIVLVALVSACVGVYLFFYKVVYAVARLIENDDSENLNDIVESFFKAVASVTKSKFKRNITSIEFNGVKVNYDEV